MHQHRAHSHRRRVSAAISVAVLAAGLVTTLAAGTAVAETTGSLYVGGASADDGGSCTQMTAPCATLQGALTKVVTGDTIVLRDNLTVTAQVTVSTPGITIDGAGYKITAGFDAGDYGENAVLGVFNSSNVTIQNLAVDGGTGNSLLGIHAFRAGLQLAGVTIQNAGRAGLLVNGSDVTATGLATSGNAWGSVEVDSGVGVAEASKFTVDSLSSLGDATQVWSDGVHDSGKSTVDAPGYDVYHVNDTKDQPLLRVWSRGQLGRPGAYILGTGVREFYASVQSAVDAAPLDGTVVVTGSPVLASQVTVLKSLTIDGGGHTIGTSLNNDDGTGKQVDPNNNSVIGVQNVSGVTIKNLAVDASHGVNVRGVNAFRAGVLLSNVTVTGSDRMGLLVNGSTVTAKGLTTHDNAWGSVEVDSGVGVTEPSKFSIDSTSVLGDKTQIWSDGNSSAPSTVDAIGYDVYYVKDNTGQEDLRIWAKDALTRSGAWFENGEVRDFYASLQSAVDNAPENATVVIAGDVTAAKQVTVSTPGITIDGAGYKITAGFDAGDYGENAVLGVFNSSNVTIQNLTVDGGTGNSLLGIHAFRAGLQLTSVTIQNAGRAGLLVNGSDVAATGLTTSGNAWGSVEVDSGVGVTEPSTFTVDSSSSLGDATQVWSDGANVDSGETTVNAPGYDVYHVHGTERQPLLRIWSKGPLARPGAYVLYADGVREFYPTISGAISTAENNTVYVTEGDYTSANPVLLGGAITIEGTPGGTAWKNLHFNVTSGNVAIHNFVFDATSTLVVAANDFAVNASYNYWGSASPDFKTLVSGDVTYSPWYIDSTLQVSIDDETPRAQIDLTAGGGTASTSNIDTSGTKATATGASGTITMVALPTTTAGSDIPSTGSSTVPTKVVDLSVSAAAAIDSIDLKVCGIGAATELRWWNTKATPPAWQKVTPVTSAGDCLIAVITNSSSPSISDLTGTVFAAVKIVSTPGGGAGGDGIGGDSGSTTPPSGSTSRIAGSNRYATAALIAEQFIKTDSAYTGAVVLANGENFKQGLDALSANYLAGAQHAPILLTQAGALPAATVAGLRAVLTGQAGATIYVMGGVDSVSDAAVAQAKKIAETVTGGTVTVQRIAGADRYATSAASATSSGAVGTVAIGSGTGMKTVVLASGEVNADALAAGSLSFAAHLPVLLTQAGSLPNPVQEAITKLGVKQVIVLGGTDRVSAAVVKSLAAIGVTSVTRIAGTDRFDTAARIYRFARSNASVGMDGSAVYLANGITGFPDALAVGPLAGATNSSVLTVTGTSLPGTTAKFLTSYKASVTSVVPLGASATVAQSVVDAATAALG